MKSFSYASRTLGLSLALGCTAASWTAAAWAQDSDDEQASQDGVQLDMITVEGNRGYEMAPSEETGGYSVDAATVGTKTPAALRDIPQSISIVTRDSMDDRNLDVLDEMARKTPGMRVLSNDIGRSSITARGYEYSEYNIDGLPAPMSSKFGTVPSLVAFDRVEVMRGPSGLFNSTSELGGIVNLVRKRPTREFQGNVTGRYGSWNQQHLSADLSGPLTANGDIRGRVVAADSQSDGFVDHNENSRKTFYGTIDADITDVTTASLAYLRQDRELWPNNGRPLDQNGELLNWDSSRSFGAAWNEFEMESDDVIGELTHRFDNGGYGRIATRYSERQVNYNYAFPFPGASVNANNEIVAPGPPGPPGPPSIYAIGNDFQQESWSTDASYSQTFGWLGNVSEYVVGVDYKRYETDDNERSASVATQPVHIDDVYDLPYQDVAGNGDPSSIENRELEETGVYSKLTLRPTAGLAVIGGVRVSSYEVSTVNETSGQTNEREDSSQATPYAGLVYDLTRRHSLYVSYSEVFKPQTSTDSNGDVLEPRQGTQYEGGIKGSYFGGELNSRVSIYRLIDQNSPAQNANMQTVAIGERVVEGAEVEISGSPMRGLDLISGYTYTDMEITEGSAPRTFSQTPQHMFDFWGQYTLQDGQLAGLRLGAGINAVDEFESGAVQAPGYAVLDLMAGYDFTSNVSGQINVNNVLDKKYAHRVGGTGVFNFYGEPANVTASLKYEF